MKQLTEKVEDEKGAFECTSSLTWQMGQYIPECWCACLAHKEIICVEVVDCIWLLML